MTDKEILKEIMKQAGMSNGLLAKKVGYSTTSGVSEKFRRKEAMRFDTFVKLLTALDGTVVVRHGNEEYEVSFDEPVK